MFKSLPYNNILDLSKFEVFADNKINVSEKLELVICKTLWEKGKCCLLLFFSFSLNVF